MWSSQALNGMLDGTTPKACWKYVPHSFSFFRLLLQCLWLCNLAIALQSTSDFSGSLGLRNFWKIRQSEKNECMPRHIRNVTLKACQYAYQVYQCFYFDRRQRMHACIIKECILCSMTVAPFYSWYASPRNTAVSRRSWLSEMAFCSAPSSPCFETIGENYLPRWSQCYCWQWWILSIKEKTAPNSRKLDGVWLPANRVPIWGVHNQSGISSGVN